MTDFKNSTATLGTRPADRHLVKEGEGRLKTFDAFFLVKGPASLQESLVDYQILPRIATHLREVEFPAFAG